MKYINPSIGLPMSGRGLDVVGTPYGCSSNSFDDETSQSFVSNYIILSKYWNWKVDVAIMLIAIGIMLIFEDKT